MNVPGQEAFVQVLGEPVRYFWTGAGPPVVLLHGLGEAALVWHGNMPSLASQFTVYAPDLPGHGRSGRARPPYTPEQGAAFVTGFLDGLAISSAHLVGNSLGGLLALQVARDHPGRVRSLVLEDSAGLGREAAGFLRAMALPGVGEGMARPSRGSIRRLMRILFYNPALIPSDLVEALYEERRRPGNKEALLHILRAGVTVRGVKAAMVLRDHLSSLSVPTLVMWGRQDRVFPVAHGEEAARRLPQGRIHVLEECGHWPHIERREEFDQVLADFLVGQEARLSQAGGNSLSRG